VNILDLLNEDGLSPQKKSDKDGGIYASGCPWCGGKDRFHVWPNQGDSGRWWCRQCDRKGDAVQYLKDFRNMNYVEACHYLGKEPAYSRSQYRSKPELHRLEWKPEPPKPAPSEIWQEKAGFFVETAEKVLWSNAGIHYLSWLEGRGLNPETIKKNRLGFNSQVFYRERALWGLENKLNSDGKQSRIWLPPGLVIPTMLDNKIVSVRIRQHEPSSPASRYALVSGSVNSPKITGGSDCIVVVESDLDAMLIFQEAGDLVSVLSLGSVTAKPDSEITKRLQNARLILISLDKDQAGAKASWDWCSKHFRNAKRWPSVRGKDPCEAFQNGLDIRSWIIAGLPYRQLQGVQRTLPVDQHNGASSTVLGVDYILVTDADFLIEVISPFFNTDSLAIDLKTTGPDPHSDTIRLIQIAGENGPAVIIDFMEMGAASIEPVKLLLASNSEKVFHNAKSSLKFLKKIAINVNGPIFDTMLAAQVLSCGDTSEPSLGGLSEKYLREFLPNDKLGDWGKDLGRHHFSAAARDAGIILRLKSALAGQLQNVGLVDVAELEFGCLPAVVEMELSGMLIDLDTLGPLAERLDTEKQRLQGILSREFGDINLNSAPQLLPALQNKGIRVPDTKSESLLPFVADYPFVADLIQYRKISHAIQNFTEKLPNHVNPQTGRIHPSFNQLGAATGRFSCTDPNLQGIPRSKEFRRCIKAEAGHKLVIADYSQIELRIVAEISGDQRMIQAYQDGLDLHRLTASLLSGKHLDQVTAEDRQSAKAVNFGLIYAMGADGLRGYAKVVYNVDLTIEEAQRFRNTFFQSYSGIAAWHRSTSLRSASETKTLSGRRRQWPFPAKITELLNTPVQGTSADILKIALGNLPEALHGTGAKIVACVHDEIILEVPEEKTEEAATILKGVMESAGKRFLKQVPVLAEPIVANSWADK
jgi:DNA polymerase I